MLTDLLVVPSELESDVCNSYSCRILVLVRQLTSGLGVFMGMWHLGRKVRFKFKLVKDDNDDDDHDEVRLQAEKCNSDFPETNKRMEEHAANAHFWRIGGMDVRRRALLSQVIDYMIGEYSAMLKMNQKVDNLLQAFSEFKLCETSRSQSHEVKKVDEKIGSWMAKVDSKMSAIEKVSVSMSVCACVRACTCACVRMRACACIHLGSPMYVGGFQWLVHDPRTVCASGSSVAGERTTAGLRCPTGGNAGPDAVK